jgi:polysaccharide biosynthesis protein PslG
MKERIFAEAKAMGARFIRVDVELSGIFAEGAADWGRLDEVLELSRRYELPVLGIFLSPPAWLAPHDAQAFADLAAQVAEHARGRITHWELFNEPDGGWAFRGTPQDYAHLLRATHEAVKARVPDAQIALGAIMFSNSFTWINRVFATPGADAAHAFDIASVNLRDTTRRLPKRVAAWRAELARHGFTGPMWVTEHGYSAEPRYQIDPAFRGGEAAQAAYLTESVLSLAAAGAAEVFVTLRDNLYDRFLSEGVVSIAGGPPYEARRKPAFAAMRRLADDWEILAPAYAQRRLHEKAMRDATRRGVAAERRLRASRILLRAGVRRLVRLRARHVRARRHDVQLRLGRQVAMAEADIRRRRRAVAWARASAADYRSRAALHTRQALALATLVSGR